MDPQLIELVIKGGPVALIAAFGWIVSYLRRIEKENRRLHAEARQECEKNSDKARSEWTSQRLELMAKLDRLEDRQFGELKSLTEDALSGLSATTHALMKFCADNDLTPPMPFSPIKSPKPG